MTHWLEGIFEFLFKYRPAEFAKGSFAFGAPFSVVVMLVAAAASNNTITENGAPTAKLPLANSVGRYLNRNWKRLSTVLPLQATS